MPRYTTIYARLENNNFMYATSCSDASLQNYRYIGHVHSLSKSSSSSFSILTTSKDSKQRKFNFTTNDTLLYAIWIDMIESVCSRTIEFIPCTLLLVLNLNDLYTALREVYAGRGKYSTVLYAFSETVVITSDYPRCCPLSGEYVGHAGLLKLLSVLSEQVGISEMRIQKVIQKDDLAIVVGRETVCNRKGGLQFRQSWSHELRLSNTGTIAHLHMKCDATAAAVAFAINTSRPDFILPKDQVQTNTTCPPGTLNVIVISGWNLKRSKRLPRAIMPIAEFHLHAATYHEKTMNGMGTKFKTRKTNMCNNASSNRMAPSWTECLSIPYSGGVPGTPTFLSCHLKAGDGSNTEALGTVTINLASILYSAGQNEETRANSARPLWYKVQPPAGSKRNLEFDDASNVVNEHPAVSDMGWIALGIHFKSTEVQLSEAVPNETARSLQRRESFDRLVSLREEAASHFIELTVDDASVAGDATTTTLQKRKPTSRNRLGSYDDHTSHPDSMHTFDVSGTSFRVYKRYQLIKSVGHGAYGVVVACSDQRTGGSVAVKNVPRTFDDLIDAKRIVREIRLMRHLHHINIISLIDVMRPPSLATFMDTYIVTELMETDLHRVIHSKEGLEKDHICYIMYQLICAVRYLHSAQIIHRDIKPSNILINKECQVKLCDFGLSRGVKHASDECEKVEKLTEYVVTRWYRAPEILLSSTYDEKVDIWSIGCIFAELFERNAVFPGHDHLHQLHMITKVLGSPLQSDLESFVTSDKAKKWMLRQSFHPKKSLSSKFPTVEPHALDLMGKLLQFNPQGRITLDEAIEHPYFSTFRDPRHENLCEKSFDFSFEDNVLDRPALQRLIFEDVCHFHPEALSELNSTPLKKSTE